jgi:serine phosphatase RsbU (regulator of sigma subunit)/anti-sigma regulatory factor (Ser/Thr protein kinase)/anti-anti-sigma regulatory factor
VAVLPGGAHDDDMRGRMVGEAGVVRDAFEQLPILLAALDGPDHCLAAVNAAYRAFTGKSDVIGVPYRDAFPGLATGPLQEMLDRVYATGQPETRTEWRAQIGPAPESPESPETEESPGGRTEVYADFTVMPRRAADGTVNGLLVMATDVTGRAARGVVAELQEALLPASLPVLPRVRIAARYLVAGQEQSAGGDWFDAIPLADGSVALVVGDVVGHGVAASAAMGQLRAVLTELLAAEADLGRVLERTDAFAARSPALGAATLALAVLDPASGKLRYTTCGHPPPLVIGIDGVPRYLEGTGTGPLGTGSRPVLATSVLAPGELVLLYSDGLVERPDRTIDEGMAGLAAAAAGAAAEQGLALAADPAAERVCQRTVELLTRTGRADDVTALAAQRLARPVPGLRLELPSERPSLTTARDAFAGWLTRIDAADDDADALHLALVEVFTNAIEHAYPRDQPGIIELEARLGDDGNVEGRVTDHGRWRQPDPADGDRGHGLMVAGQVIDRLLVSHPTRGTIVTLRHRLGRPAILASGHDSAHAAHPGQAPFTVDTSIAESPTARALVRGPVDITTADQLARRLLSVSRGGTVPLVADLTGVTQLASAGVRALYAVSGQMAAHGQDLTLITTPGSAAHAVLDLVRLAHVAGEER